MRLSLAMLSLSTKSNALTPVTLRLSVISSRGFWTSRIALLLIGNAYLNKAPGSLIGGPEIKIERSGSTVPEGDAYAGQSSVGIPVTNPIVNAMEIEHSFRWNVFFPCPEVQNIHKLLSAFTKINRCSLNKRTQKSDSNIE